MIEDQWRKDVYRGWTVLLLAEFARLQQEHLELKSLRPPNLHIDPALSRTLGSWDESSRRLTMSAQLFERADWSLITAVFKHELAHQMVSELFGIKNAVPHGEAFSRACRMLNISPDRTLAISPDDRPEKRMHERIQKLLALSESPNPHEAAQALAKAHELSVKHNIDVDAADHLYTFRLVGPVLKRVPRYLWAIAGIVSDYYAVIYICNAHREPANGDVVKQFELYGTLENLELAEYVFYFLLHQGDQQWRRHRAQGGQSGRRNRLSFLQGLYDGFRSTLQDKHEQLAVGEAVVHMGDPKLAAFFQQRHPSVSRRRVYARIDEHSHEAGQVAGRKMRLHPGLGVPRQQPRLLG